MKCRVCNSQIVKFFSLGEMPLVNSLLKEEEIPFEKKYDLNFKIIKTISNEELFWGMGQNNNSFYFIR